MAPGSREHKLLSGGDSGGRVGNLARAAEVSWGAEGKRVQAQTPSTSSPDAPRVLTGALLSTRQNTWAPPSPLLPPTSLPPGNGRGRVCVHVRAQSCPLSGTPWTGACQALLSMEFTPEYWSGLTFPNPGNLPDPGVEPASLALLLRQAGFLLRAQIRE